MGMNLLTKLPFPMILKSMKLVFISFVGIAFFLSNISWGYPTDPLYEKLLREGEKSYLARNYGEAVKVLEIAAFGLHRENKLLSKAYAYLSLCYYHLKNNVKSKDYFGKVLTIVKGEGFGGLEIHQSALDDLKDLIEYFKIGEPKEKEELPTASKTQFTPPESTPREKKSADKNPLQISENTIEKSNIKELEKTIKAQPHNIPLYYQLYNLYRKERDVRAATQLLEFLVMNNPHEVNAWYLLAKIKFAQKKYNNALEDFNRIIKPANDLQVDNLLLLKSLMYVVVCFYYLDQMRHIESFVSLVEESISPDQCMQMLKEEGLEKDWIKIKRALGKK